MDESVQVLVKKEIIPEADESEEELIIPDVVGNENILSPHEDFKKAIKTEPLETSSFMDADDDLENPYQCFECGLDCDSQRALIDHYETAHSGGGSRETEGISSLEARECSDDPLAGDVAPDSPQKAANVEGAQNDAAPHEVLLLYSCPCCGHSSPDWNHLVKHIQEHVQVTCLACSKCLHFFSNNYRLNDYTGKDGADQPHVCWHCPFKTRWLQVLKDHCVTHHRNNPPNCDSNIIPSSIPQTTLISSNAQPSPIQMALPYNVSEPGCYMVLDNSGAHKDERFAPVNNIFHQNGPNSINFIPKVMQSLDPIIPTLPKVAMSTIEAQSGLPNEGILARLMPKLSELPAPAPLMIPKPAPRTLPPKVPVNELLEKWKFVPPELQPSPNPLKTPLMPVSTSKINTFPAMPSEAHKSSDLSRKRIKTKPCPYCSHVARDSHSLKTHIFIHTKEKPYACEFCNYRATQRAHVQKHMSTHLNGNRRGKHNRNGESMER